MIFFIAVPAILPLIPALASSSSIAVVSSIPIPAALAIGATYFIDSAKASISKAEDAKLKAITSVTRPVSSASKPKPLNVAPATSAALARSDPLAWAKNRVLSVTLSISEAVNPSFANSTCKEATSRAVKTVVDPKFLAFSVSIFNWSAVAPDTAFTLLISDSKSANTFTLVAPIIAMGAERPRDRVPPTFLAVLPNRLSFALAVFRAAFKGPIFAPTLKLVLPNVLAIC